MSITVSRIDGDNFVVQSKFEKGVVTVRVVVPRTENDRPLDDTERESAARQLARDLVSRFAQDLP
jgi:hypothetical protein